MKDIKEKVNYSRKSSATFSISAFAMTLPQLQMRRSVYCGDGKLSGDRCIVALALVLRSSIEWNGMEYLRRQYNRWIDNGVSNDIVTQFY